MYFITFNSGMPIVIPFNSVDKYFVGSNFLIISSANKIWTDTQR